MQRAVNAMKWGLLAVLVIANAVIWQAVLAAERDTLRVAFLDVGQGDAIFIEAPNGNQMLVDGGPNDAVLAALAKQMPWWDRSIDVVLATHPDADHIGGLPAVLARYETDVILRSGVERKTGMYRALDRAGASEDARVIDARRGQLIRLSPRVFLQILFPSRGAVPAEANAASVVARLVYGEHAVLLTGDTPRRIETLLAGRYGGALEADILKVAHHGSDTSSAPALLGYASPAYAVISAGADNPHGHPHDEVVQRLKRFEAEVARTDKHGTIVFESDGKRWRRIE